jgi:acyl transferase domain-containing protein
MASGLRRPQRSVLHAAGFLEIDCVNGTIAGEASVTRIKDIIWIQPLRLTTEDHLVKTFLMSNGNETEFVIVSFNDDNERVVYSEGRMSYERQSKHGDEVQARYSIEALKNRAEKTVSGSACYRQFEDFGFRYGPCFRTLQELHVGSDFALSRLDLTEELKGDFEQYILHPCIVDAALQTAIGIATGGAQHAASAVRRGRSGDPAATDADLLCLRRARRSGKFGQLGDQAIQHPIAWRERRRAGEAAKSCRGSPSASTLHLQRFQMWPACIAPCPSQAATN